MTIAPDETDPTPDEEEIPGPDTIEVPPPAQPDDTDVVAPGPVADA